MEQVGVRQVIMEQVGFRQVIGAGCCVAQRDPSCRELRSAALALLPAAAWRSILYT